MRLRTVIEILAALLLTFAALAAISQMAKASGVTVENAYARASIGAVANGAVYLTLRNEAAGDDRLRSASTDVAGRAELHLHAAQNDIMTMENITCLTVPAGGEVEFAPGGLHVMLLGLASPLKEGDMFSLHLTFDNAGVVAVDVPVKKPAAGSGHSHATPSLRLCD